MTQISVNPPSLDRHGRGWIILLQNTFSEAAHRLVHPGSDKKLGEGVEYLSLAELASRSSLVVKPSVDLLLKPIDERLGAISASKASASVDVKKKQALLGDLRGYSRDIVHPLMRTLWQQGFSEKPLAPEIPETELLDAPQSSRRVLSYDERVCLAAMRKTYGEWFWPNITGLCFLVMAKAAIEGLLEDSRLDTCLKPLTQMLLQDGNIPLGLDAKGTLLVLTG